MKLLVLAAMIGFSLLVLVIGAPAVLEPSREEARCVQALFQTQQIKAGTLPTDTVDPWGMPFRISKDDDGVLIVTSLGRNMSSPTDGFGDDDISSDMTSPPHKKMIRGRQRQLLTTLILAVSPWIVLSIGCFRTLVLRLWGTAAALRRTSRSP
jgi:hypothetical protein